jgi:hypothetical protein
VLSAGAHSTLYRSRELVTETGDGEKFVWAPIKGPEGGSTNYIWAPISQEELFLEKLTEKQKDKKGTLTAALVKRVAKSASVECLVGAAVEGTEEQEVRFINDEEEVRAGAANNRYQGGLLSTWFNFSCF